MSVAKTIEITSESPKSFEDAVDEGIAKAAQTVDDIKGAWVGDQEVVVENGKVTAYKVRLKVTFVLK
ncbi:MAG: dodecin family protein [Acidobacteriota bacterium]